MFILFYKKLSGIRPIKKCLKQIRYVFRKNSNNIMFHIHSFTAKSKTDVAARCYSLYATGTALILVQKQELLHAH